MRTTLTSKGQVTIPINIREAYRLDTGDSLEFIPDGDELRVRVIKRHTAKQLRGLLETSVKFSSREDERAVAAQALGSALGAGAESGAGTDAESGAETGAGATLEQNSIKVGKQRR